MPEELGRLDLEAGFLAQLAPERVERMLELLDEAAGEVPEAGTGIVSPAPEQDAAVALDQRLRAGNRVRIDRRAALLALGPALLVPERPGAERAEAPAIEDPHRATVSR